MDPIDNRWMTLSPVEHQQTKLVDFSAPAASEVPSTPISPTSSARSNSVSSSESTGLTRFLRLTPVTTGDWTVVFDEENASTPVALPMGP